MRIVAAAAVAMLVVAPGSAQRSSSRQERPDPRQARAREAGDIALLLSLADRQRPALDVYLAADRPPPPPGDRPPPGPTPPSGDTARDRFPPTPPLAMVEEEQRARASFYAQLDPRQRTLFDALERLRHRPFGGPSPGPDGRGAPPPR